MEILVGVFFKECFRELSAFPAWRKVWRAVRGAAPLPGGPGHGGG